MNQDWITSAKSDAPVDKSYPGETKSTKGTENTNSSFTATSNSAGVSIPPTNDGTSSLPFVLMGIAFICLACVLSKSEKRI